MQRIFLCLYAVPNPKKRGGGSRTRINKIGKAIRENDPSNVIIQGSPLEKIKSILTSSRIDICYVESSTNRLKLVDLLCLIVLRLKSKKMVVFIRDIYTILFPDVYQTLRRRITKIANSLSNYFYIAISDQLAFPTRKMGKIYSEKFNTDLTYFELPPGTFDVKYFSKNTITEMACLKTEDISFLYLGGTSYKNSGINTYLDLVEQLGDKYKFHILTPDDICEDLRGRGIENKLTVNSVKHDEVFQYIEDNKISFLIHSRPLNEYDSITFPIKIMDCVSIGLPIISLPHPPLIDLLGRNYDFFVDGLTKHKILELLSDGKKVEAKYYATLEKLLHIRNSWLYKNQVEKIIEEVS